MKKEKGKLNLDPVLFYTKKSSPPPAKILAATAHHLLCKDTNDLGEISGRGVCINKIFIHGFSLGNMP